MKQNKFRTHKPLITSPVPKNVSKPKIKWRILPLLWSAVKKMCMALGAMILISAIFAVISFSTIKAPTLPATPDKAVLYLEFKNEITETPARPSFTDPFSGGQPTLRQMIKAIDTAADDPKIQGIVARMYDGQFQLAHIQELRAAIKHFKADGKKFTTIYSSSYGGMGSGLGRFYLASIFNERWMQPMGIVSITGLRIEVPYFKNILDKIGIKPEFIQRKEYKTAYESVMKSDMTPENKRMLTEVKNTIRSEILNDIPSDLKMDERTFQSLMKNGIFTSDQALEKGLITHNNYPDTLERKIASDLHNDPDYDDTIFISVRHYLQNTKEKATDKKQHVALIYASGVIMSTNGDDFAKDGTAASEIIAPAIRTAAEDDNIKAIILRIDSPGGSPVASETILRTLKEAQKRGKKVIISMGATAASGGYWIASSADQIFAMPTTLTGSIGVVGGKISVQELWRNLGIKWNTDIKWGQNAGIWSMNTPFSPSEKAQIETMLDHVYDSFIQRVAQGRGMTTLETDKIARGRVWTGKQALEIGLVDQLGGLTDALDYTAKQLDLETRENLAITILPKPKTFQEEIIDLLANSGAVFESLKLQAQIGQMLKPVMEQTQVLGHDGLSTYESLRIQ